MSRSKASRPTATSWDKISAQDTHDTLANRDVHTHQQLDRRVRMTKRSKTPGVILGIIAGLILAGIIWWLYSTLMMVIAMVGNQFSDDPASPTPSLTSFMMTVSFMKLVWSGAAGLVAFVVISGYWNRQANKYNVRVDHSDINDYYGDQHIMVPEEIQRHYSWFPDAGAHSSVEVNSMISHMMLSAKGLKKIAVTQRVDHDVTDRDGTILYYAGDSVDDSHGSPKTTTLPIIDEQFGDNNYDSSGLPNDASLRLKYDTTTIPYNKDGKYYDKYGTYATVDALINDDWTFPEYEVQRPAGAYIVDSAPVNTMVIAITRGGKGQTYIEPVLDMWSRERRPSNMVVNDPKGELLRKFYVPFVTRGFEVIQFNLMNPMKTDIYNVLGLAADAAREGDFTKCAQYVENIATVFFPLDGGEDPVWPNAANNAFKRAAYGLIDFYLEEEYELRAKAAVLGMDPEILDQKLDDLWGKVTLYNCYQLFVQMTSKKMKNPLIEFEQRVKNNEFSTPQEVEEEKELVERWAALWKDQPEVDMLTLYFNATEALPRNNMRTLVGNAHNALQSMAGADKMLASVYGIAITAMSFFTDPTIATLTSGKPSQNTDLAGLSFPRRLGIRFAANYLERDHIIGLQARWSAYGDNQFTQDLGKDFTHDDIINRTGWARYIFKGIFPTDTVWLKLELLNPQTGMLVRTFFFQFTKSYQLSLTGRHYVREPVTNRKIVRNGVLRELVPVREGGTQDGKILRFEPGDTTYPDTKLDLTSVGVPEKVSYQARAITQMTARYSEMPKAVFLATPPHLMKYARLILILIKQLFDVSVDQSYLTKANQKPLYKVRFMLDEFGNLQSDGKGIDGLETMLSIGLGQGMQFTLILQTLQQLRNVYGDDSDKILQGNINNLVFIKSTDDAMLETLEKMSGTHHVSHADSKQVTENLDKVMGGKTEGAISHGYKTEEEPLITYNDMAFIAPSNSIVFRSGDAPIWNRNSTILPVSRQLHKNTIIHPGHTYSLQTIPTMSSAIDFDVRRNQPDFTVMLEKRMEQAKTAEQAITMYRELHDYKDVDIARLDPDVYAGEVMDVIRAIIDAKAGRDNTQPEIVDPDDYEAEMSFDSEDMVPDEDTLAAIAQYEHDDQDHTVLRYAEKTISRDMLVYQSGAAKTGDITHVIGEAYKLCRTELEHDTRHFSVGGDGELRSADGTQTYISAQRSSAYMKAAHTLNSAITNPRSRVYANAPVTDEDMTQLMSVTVHPEFIQWLASLPSWEPLAGGIFDRTVAAEMRADAKDH